LEDGRAARWRRPTPSLNSYRIRRIWRALPRRRRHLPRHRGRGRDARWYPGQPRWCDAQAQKPIIVRQDDAATVQKRQQIAEQFTLGLLGQVIRDAMLAEQLARKLTGASVAGHTA